MKTKYKILFLLLVLALIMSFSFNFYLLYNRNKFYDFKNNNNNVIKENSIIKNDISDLKNKIKNIEDRQNNIETNLTKIINDINDYNNSLIQIQNQTTSGKDNNIKIIISLLELKDYILLGKDFSESLDILEDLTRKNNVLHTIIMKFYDYKNHTITNDDIMKNFLRELNNIKIDKNNDKKLINLIKSNIRMVKSNESKNISLILEKFKDLLNKNEYSELLNLLEQNKNVSNFENTIKIISIKLELSLLIKEALNIVYKQN